MNDTHVLFAIIICHSFLISPNNTSEYPVPNTNTRLVTIIYVMVHQLSHKFQVFTRQAKRQIYSINYWQTFNLERSPWRSSEIKRTDPLKIPNISH